MRSRFQARAFVQEFGLAVLVPVIPIPSWRVKICGERAVLGFHSSKLFLERFPRALDLEIRLIYLHCFRKNTLQWFLLLLAVPVDCFYHWRHKTRHRLVVLLLVFRTTQSPGLGWSGHPTSLLFFCIQKWHFMHQRCVHSHHEYCPLRWSIRQFVLLLSLFIYWCSTAVTTIKFCVDPNAGVCPMFSTFLHKAFTVPFYCQL